MLITERPSLLRIADKLFELEDGRLVARQPQPEPTAAPAEMQGSVQHA